MTVPKAMRAAMAYEGDEHFRVETVDVPELQPGDVLVKVAAAGLTHGLLNLWRRRGRIKLLPAPLSQEIAGTVAAVADGASTFDVGDRVRVHPTLSCRQCEFCKSGEEVFCDQISVLGHAVYSEAAMPLYKRYHWGGLAEYVKVPEWALDALPASVAFDLGAKVHSIAVTQQAIRKSGLGPGGVLAITGATGAQGAVAIRLAAAIGAAKVIAIARTRDHLEEVQVLEPDLVEIIPLEELPAGWETDRGLTSEIRRLTAGRGPDVLLDFLPAAPAVTVQAIYALRKGGSAVLVGGNWNELPLVYGMLMNNGWRISGSQAAAREDAAAILSLLESRRVDLDPLVTHRFQLERVNDAVDVIDSRSAQPLLVVVNP